MAICPRCSAENKEGRRACWNCWTTLEAEAPVRAAADLSPQPETIPASAMPETVPPPDDTTPEPEAEPPLPPSADLPDVIPPPAEPEPEQPVHEFTAEMLLADQVDEHPAPVEEAEDALEIVMPADEPEESDTEPSAEEMETPESDSPADETLPEAETLPGPPIEEEGLHAHAPPEEPLTNAYVFVADSAVRASRRGEVILLTVTAVLASLIIGMILVWFFTAHAKPRAQAPGEVAQAYLNAITSGNTLEQAQFSTADSRGRRLPGGWLTVNTAVLTGPAVQRGNAATVPLTMSVILTLPDPDPATPAMPLSKSCTLTLPLTREGEDWRVDQHRFFTDLQAALVKESAGTQLPAWE